MVALNFNHFVRLNTLRTVGPPANDLHVHAGPELRFRSKCVLAEPRVHCRQRPRVICTQRPLEHIARKHFWKSFPESRPVPRFAS